jgi:hypothetical protein
MEWLEQNIDAYRIVAEILDDLRAAVRQGLEEIHGEKWYRTGLPETVLERLVAAKEREQAIDWYESQYQQIMDYAVFPDLLEILEFNAEAFSGIMGLAPSPALLQARFMELEVMRAKLGRTRPVSESELSFLGTFHLRFRKAMTEVDTTKKAAKKAPTQKAEPKKKRAEPKEKAKVTEAESEYIEAAPEEEPAKPAKAKKATPPKRKVQSTVKPPPEEEKSEKPSSDLAEEAPTPTDDADQDEDEPRAHKKLGQALAEGDHQVVLRELYREVTTIAEGMWTNEYIPVPVVWERVVGSDWYEHNFSRLGLQPLSDFFDVIAKVDKKLSSGVSKEDLQEFLKEANFAKILLSMRDMFQQNSI